MQFSPLWRSSASISALPRGTGKSFGVTANGQHGPLGGHARRDLAVYRGMGSDVRSQGEPDRG